MNTTRSRQMPRQIDSPNAAARNVLFLITVLLITLGLSACASAPLSIGSSASGPDASTAPVEQYLPAVESVRAQLQAQQSVALPARPQRLRIPALDVDTQVEAVGRGEDDTMGLPSHWDVTAWYAPGPRPGELGNAVIAGHFNTPRDRPAVFWDLKKLEAGDTVHVYDSDGTRHIFLVESVRAYPFDAAPINDIFGFDPSARRLNLITCAGEWSKTVGNYTERLVVRTTLQASLPARPNLARDAQPTRAAD